MEQQIAPVDGQRGVDLAKPLPLRPAATGTPASPAPIFLHRHPGPLGQTPDSGGKIQPFHHHDKPENIPARARTEAFEELLVRVDVKGGGFFLFEGTQTAEIDPHPPKLDIGTGHFDEIAGTADPFNGVGGESHPSVFEPLAGETNRFPLVAHQPPFPHLNNSVNSSTSRLPQILYPLSYFLFFAASLFAQDAGSKSRVAYLENPNLLDNYDPKPEPVKKAVASLLTTLTGKEKPADAWKDLGIAPDDTVAVKIAALGDARTSTAQEVVNAVTASLAEAGVKPENIIVWDKLERDLTRSGFPVGTPKGKSQIRAVIAGSTSDIPGLGWDPDTPPYFNPTMGELIYGDLKFQPSLLDGLPPAKTGGSSDRTPYWSYFTKLVTRKDVKIINLGTMTSDPDLGIYGCCASLALGSVDNTRRLMKPNADQDTSIGEILISDPLKPKTVLHISDGLIVKFAGNRSFDANYASAPGILLASKDPVALDTMAIDRFEKLRLNPGPGTAPIPKIGNVPHLAGAALVGAGNTDPGKIDILNVR